MDNFEYAPDARKQRAAKNDRKKMIFIIGISSLAVIAALVIVLTAFPKKTTSGLLMVNVNRTDAVITAARQGREDKRLGTGTLQVRLDPGNYTITAKTANAESAQAVVVSEQQDTNADIILSDMQQPSQLAQYTAQDIFVQGKKLYFLDTPFHIINSFTPGDYRAYPYAADAYPLNRVIWINEQRQYAQDSGNTWFSIVNQKATPMLYRSSMLDFSTIDFNSSGAFTYIDRSKRLVRQDGPGAKPVAIASDLNQSSKVAISDKGDILVYSPQQNYQSDVSDVKLYSKANNSLTTIPETVKGATYAVWSKDGGAFAYSSQKGLFVYETATKSSTPISSIQPDSPTSMTWTQSGKLIYAQGRSIWQYDPKTTTSNKVTNIEGMLSNNPQPFYVEKDSSKLYYGTIPSDGKGGYIYSSGLVTD